MRRVSLLLLLLLGGVFALSAAPAAASVTIGQVPPGVPGSACTTSDLDNLQATVTSGDSYSVPTVGGVTSWILTSWSHYARAATGQQLTMKVFRKVAEPSVYMAVGHDGPRPLVGGSLNTFQTNLAVRSGDVLGLNLLSPVFTGCYVSWPAGNTSLGRTGGLADGVSGTIDTPNNGIRLNVSAVVKPSNSFNLGRIARNKKKGTATLTLDLPNPGDLTASGNGVKAASAGRAVISKSVGAGQAQLLIKAKGTKKKRLNETGKVKLNVAVTYTPTGGDLSTRSLEVKLVKR